MKKVLFPILALLLALGLALPMASGASPDPGIVGLWHLDEGSGTTASDSSGNGNDGTLLPMGSEPTWTSGKYGNALSFDGVDDYVQVPDSATLRLTSNMTVEAWVYISALASDWVRVVGKGDSTYRNYGLWYHGPSGKVLFQIYDGTGLKANAGTTWGTVVNALTVSTEAWYHFAGVKEGSTVYLYLDSVLVASAPITFTPATSSDPLRLGYAGFHSRHNGLIDEVRIWDEALSAGVIAEHAAASMVLDKTMLEDGYLGDHVTVTLDLENPYTHNLTVKDVIPDGLKYIPGTFAVDGSPVTPTVVDNTISVSVLPGVCNITFDVQVVEVQCTDVDVTNWAYLGYDDTEVASDSEDITLHPYEGFEKTVEIVQEDGDWDGIVEVNELVTWNMTITVPNNFGWNIIDAVLKDNLGGELGMAGDDVNNDRLKGKDDGAFGDLAEGYNTIPDGDLTFKTPGKSNKVHFWIKEIDITVGDSLDFVLGIFTDKNPSKWGQQCYTSPCLHYLNSGATLKFTDPGTGFQLSAHTCPLPVYVTDAKLELENKDSEWQIIPDDRYGELYYSTEGDVFCYEFRGYGLEATTGYSLIYYADFDPRFTVWGGNNPGALIGTGTADGSGNLVMSGSKELNMNLPCSPDWNIAPVPDYCDYHNGFDDYDHCSGAKIWLVPSNCYDAGLKKVTTWSPSGFLFETDLITYTYTP